MDQTEKHFAGCILSCLPLKNGRSQSRLVKEMFQLDAASVSLKKFCEDEKTAVPELPLRHRLRPASPEEAGLFYAQTPEKDEELGAIGHVRIDFGHDGKGFFHSWWSRGPEELDYMATTGFCYEILTDDPGVRKAVDDIICDFYSEESLQKLEEQREEQNMHLEECEMDKKRLEFLREQFPVGSRIRLQEMKDPYAPVEPGTMGTLTAIDDIGTFHVTWDNGRGLGLVLGEDSFTVLPPQAQTLKLYMPMTVGYFEDGYEYEITMDSREAAEYAPQIIAALEKERQWLGEHDPEMTKRGLMAYFHGPDSVERKILSYNFTAEVRDGRLWGVAVCKIQGELTPKELEQLMSSVTGQASDGFGESFD